MVSLEDAIKASPLNKEHLTKIQKAMDALKGSPIFADVHLQPPLEIAASAPQRLVLRVALDAQLTSSRPGPRTSLGSPALTSLPGTQPRRRWR